MKKLSIIMATVVSLVCLLCVSASAANEVTVSVNTPASVSAGAEVTVAVDFSENDGFNTLGVKLTYPEGFTYVDDSADASALIKEEFYLDFAGYSGETYVFHHDEEARTLTFVGASLYDVENASGTLFSAKFTAPATASTGNQFKVEVIDSVYNATGEVVTLTPENGSTDVTAASYVKGDMNGDGAADFLDAQMALQLYIGAISADDLSETALLAGDVVGNDGVVDFLDATAILQAYIGLITL